MNNIENRIYNIFFGECFFEEEYKGFLIYQNYCTLVNDYYYLVFKDNELLKPCMNKTGAKNYITSLLKKEGK